MAPTAPSTKRKPLRLRATERLANPLAPRKVHRPDSVVTDSFLSSKADKLRIKHSSFVSRITKPGGSATRAARKNAKRHARKREGAKSVAMDSLADALPTLTADEVQQGDAEKEGRVRHKSLKSRPGALRKKERLVRTEMERFGVSLAQLAGVTEADAPAPAPTPSSAVGPAAKKKAAGAAVAAGDGDAMMDGVEQQAAPSAAANRFAALRGFITATMEQNPAFAQRTTSAGNGS